jgi:hypothetical protein
MTLPLHEEEAGRIIFLIFSSSSFTKRRLGGVSKRRPGRDVSGVAHRAKTEELQTTLDNRRFVW